MSTTITVQHVSKVFSEADMPRRSLGSLLRFGQSNAKDSNARSRNEGPLRFQVLHNVSFYVAAGETLAVLGPSGCGKTTLLRILAGLLEPTEGQVLYDGIPVHNIPAAQRGVGMVFQDYALYPHMVGWDNVGMFFKLRKRDAEVPPRVREISATMRINLEPILGRMPPKMSGGEKQRVAIARCLARDPRVFFFDEPFANLDAKFRSDTRVELKRLLRRYGVTSVYVTHDQNEAIALADRIAIMRAGEVVQIGTRRQLYETPLNLFVAAFFGSPSMNLFHGRIQGGNWHSDLFSWGPIRPGLPDGSAVVLGVRPEHLALHDEGEIAARIEQVEPHFTERTQVIYARMGNAQLTVLLPDTPAAQRGGTIRLSPKHEQVMLFDASTGLRIG